MNTQILTNFVQYASVISLVCSLVSLLVSIISIRKKYREKYIFGHKIVLNALKTDEDALAANREMFKVIIENALKQTKVDVEPDIIYKGRGKHLRRRMNNLAYKRYNRLRVYYWLKRMEFANKRVENLNMSIKECNQKIREAQADKIG